MNYLPPILRMLGLNEEATIDFLETGPTAVDMAQRGKLRLPPKAWKTLAERSRRIDRAIEATAIDIARVAKVHAARHGSAGDHGIDWAKIEVPTHRFKALRPQLNAAAMRQAQARAILLGILEFERTWPARESAGTEKESDE